MFKVPHRHKIPLQVKRREMTTELCEKRKVIFWMMVESNRFSRAAERLVARVESRDTSLEMLMESLALSLEWRCRKTLPWAQSWSCWVQGAGTQLQEEAEIRWELPGQGWGPILTEESLADAEGAPGFCGCKVGAERPSRRHLLGPSV